MTWASDTTTGELSPWLRDYLLGSDTSGGLLNKIEALTSSTAAPYSSTKEQALGSVQNRIAGFNPLQESVFQNIANLGPSQYLNQAAGMMGMAGMGTYNMPTAQNYMNPYSQMVTNQQKQAAIQDYQRNLPALQATGYQQGAGRGTRNALLQSEANRNLQNNLQNIQAQGLQNAWTQGQNQYNAEQNRMLQAGQGLQGVGGDYFDQLMRTYGAQQTVGATLQGQEQNMLDTAYENYLAQQREPYQQLGFFLNALAGTPEGSGTQNYYTPTPTPDLAAYKAGAITQGLGYLAGKK